MRSGTVIATGWRRICADASELSLLLQTRENEHEYVSGKSSRYDDGLTMADLLNVIDGIGASEDRVLFMTVNHSETLDFALTRAGRIDRKFYIDYARDEELRCLHNRIAQY